MEGLAVPSANLVPAPMFGHNPTLKPDAYDLNAAKKLLADAGYPNGFAMTIHGPNNRYVNDDQIMQTVAQMLTRAGIQTKVETMPMSVYLARARASSSSASRCSAGARPPRGVVAAARPPRDLHPREGLGRVRLGPLRQPEGERSPRQGARDDRRQEPRKADPGGGRHRDDRARHHSDPPPDQHLGDAEGRDLHAADRRVHARVPVQAGVLSAPGAVPEDGR